jgi:hypothetical protein
MIVVRLYYGGISASQGKLRRRKGRREGDSLGQQRHIHTVKTIKTEKAGIGG